MEFTVEIAFLNGCFKASLNKNDKKAFFPNFFQIHVFFDLDLIWKQHGYVKVSARWALKGCNNGFLISDDFGRKSGKILET